MTDAVALQACVNKAATNKPGLKLFGAQRVCDVFNGVAQTVGVVVGGIDAPAETRSGERDVDAAVK